MTHKKRNDFIHDRTKDLADICCSLSCEKKYNFADMLNIAVNSPAKRFYVSTNVAFESIEKIKANKKIQGNPLRKQMIFEIYKRYILFKQDNSYLSDMKIVEKIITQQAPKFYITPEAARKYLKKWKIIELQK